MTMNARVAKAAKYLVERCREREESIGLGLNDEGKDKEERNAREHSARRKDGSNDGEGGVRCSES